MELKKSYEASWIGMSEFYKAYPYKCRDLNSNTIPMSPYFSKDETICDHRFSLTKREYTKIIKTYFKYVSQYLFTGQQYKLRESLGIFQIRKYKSNKRVDWVKTKTLDDGYIYYLDKTKHSNYTTVVKWYRTKARFSFKWFWQLLPSVTYIKRIIKHLDTPNNIFKFNDL